VLAAAVRTPRLWRERNGVMIQKAVNNDLGNVKAVLPWFYAN
jgi:hypothetical protein